MDNRQKSAREKVAAYRLREQTARQVAQEAEAQRQTEEARLQAEAQAQAEQSALEARRGERLQAEVLDGITEEERATLRQQVREFPQLARQQAEEQFTAQLQQEREQMIITRRNETMAHGPYSTTIGRKIMQEVDQIINQKRQAFYQEREQRELQAEKHTDEIDRIVHSLDDNSRAIFNQLLDLEPKIGERVQSIRQGKTAANVATLTEQYKTAMLAARGKRSELRRIKEQYRSAGAAVDFCRFFMKADPEIYKIVQSMAEDEKRIFLPIYEELKAKAIQKALKQTAVQLKQARTAGAEAARQRDSEITIELENLKREYAAWHMDNPEGVSVPVNISKARARIQSLLQEREKLLSTIEKENI